MKLDVFYSNLKPLVSPMFNLLHEIKKFNSYNLAPHIIITLCIKVVNLFFFKFKIILTRAQISILYSTHISRWHHKQNCVINNVFSLKASKYYQLQRWGYEISDHVVESFIFVIIWNSYMKRLKRNIYLRLVLIRWQKIIQMIGCRESKRQNCFFVR